MSQTAIVDAWLTRADTAREKFEWPAFMLCLDPSLKHAEPPDRDWTLEDILTIANDADAARHFERGGKFF